MNNNFNLVNKLETLPQQSGCYLFYNKLNQVIYVGKAKNLKKRVSSYFQKLHNLKTTRLVNEINMLDFIITNTEKEALILEHNLIKKYRPKYNILLTDDRQYPYIVITNEHDPTYQYVRSLKNKYKYCYGPFPDGSYAREIIKLLQQVYPLRRCQGNLKKPCLYYHLNQCSGACFQEVSNEYYQKQLEKINNFFNGDTETVKKILVQRMKQLSQTLQFEQAEKIKRLFLKIDWSIADQTVEINNISSIDAVGIYYSKNCLIISTLFYRLGKLVFKDSHSYQLTNNEEINNVVRLYLQSLYQKNIVPEKIIIDEQINLSELKLLFTNIDYPITTSERKIISLAQENSLEKWKQEQEKVFNQNNINNILQELQILLSLPTVPYFIQSMDIANLGDSFITAGFISYKNGQPSFNDYRKYNISVNLVDDASRIASAVTKHFQKIIAQKKELPDLLIVDGAEQQLKAALTVLEQLKLKIPAVGLIKNNHHRTEKLLLTNFNRINLDKQSKLYLFLSKIQDDVHNFTINSFRRRQNKSLLTSILLEVNGLGNQKIKLLHENFSSLEAMKKASFEELNQIINNKKTTLNLQEFFKTLI